MAEIKSDLDALKRFNSGWGVRLRLSTMEGAAEAAAYQYLAETLQPSRFMPSVGGWSVQYQVIASLVDHILNSRKLDLTIVELGSGVSTSWLALALENVGSGKLISVEHHAGYAEKTEYTLNKLGIADRVNLVAAGLAPVSGVPGSPNWYESKAIYDALEGSLVDLLFIDGPPGNVGPKSRYPAFSKLLPHLADDAMIVLDDTDRVEEQNIASSWIDDCTGLRPGYELTPVEIIGRSSWMKFREVIGL